MRRQEPVKFCNLDTSPPRCKRHVREGKDVGESLNAPARRLCSPAPGIGSTCKCLSFDYDDALEVLVLTAPEAVGRASMKGLSPYCCHTDI